jgi:hypothetical protein
MNNNSMRVLPIKTDIVILKDKAFQVPFFPMGDSKHVFKNQEENILITIVKI